MVPDRRPAASEASVMVDATCSPKCSAEQPDLAARLDSIFDAFWRSLAPQQHYATTPKPSEHSQGMPARSYREHSDPLAKQVRKGQRCLPSNCKTRTESKWQRGSINRDWRLTLNPVTGSSLQHTQ
ncbi:Hypothetical predicted protein [Pelobates cultripes]|uniref:Uncharacterized protein n=1 Tax=Pelobates cultripes TaxID=61616 RepID=A0AAD1WUN0_PELCU|nr:Hypothetical predicted protein [Pelobates cultripes]